MVDLNIVRLLDSVPEEERRIVSLRDGRVYVLKGPVSSLAAGLTFLDGVGKKVTFSSEAILYVTQKVANAPPLPRADDVWYRYKMELVDGTMLEFERNEVMWNAHGYFRTFDMDEGIQYMFPTSAVVAYTEEGPFEGRS